MSDEARAQMAPSCWCGKSLYSDGRCSGCGEMPNYCDGDKEEGPGARSTPIERFRSHTIYAQLLERFKAARAAWTYITAKVEKAGLGMDQRSYCNAFVQANYPPLTWAGNATELDSDLHFVQEQAWLDSMPQ